MIYKSLLYQQTQQRVKYIIAELYIRWYYKDLSMTGWLFVPIRQLLNYVRVFFAGKDAIIERLCQSART